MKALYVDQNSKSVDNSWWGLLRSYPVEADAVIFPRLKRLTIVNRNTSAAWPLLITLNVRHLRIGALDSVSISAALRLVSKQSTALETLDLVCRMSGFDSDDGGRPSASSNSLTDAICAQVHLKRLRSIYPPQLSREALLHLSHLPSLIAFSVKITPQNFSTSGTSPLGPFSPMLRRLFLQLGGDALDVGASFLNTIPMTLVSLDIILTSQGRTASRTLLAQAISSLRNLRNLTIYLRGRGDDTTLGTHSGSSGDCLAALGNLRELKAIKLVGLGLIYDTSILQHLAKSWPALMSLNISDDGESQGHACMKLVDVLHFARNCPDLINIELTIAPLEKGWSFPRGPPLPPSVVKWLDLECFSCNEADVENVASSLAAVFPLARCTLFDHTDCEKAFERYSKLIAAQMGEREREEQAQRVTATAKKFKDYKQTTPRQSALWWRRDLPV